MDCGKSRLVSALNHTLSPEGEESLEAFTASRDLL
jgi:hypothetical protein